MLHFLGKMRTSLSVGGTEGRNPFEVFMLLWAVFIGVILFLGAPSAGSVQALLPEWVVLTWCVLLFSGGFIGLVGVFTKDLIRSLLVERAAMMIISPAAALYGIALFVAAGSRAFGAGGITLAFAVAALVRLVRISSQLHRVLVVVRDDDT